MESSIAAPSFTACRSQRTRSNLRSCAALCLLFSFAVVHAQDKPSEYDVKAAYLFNFARFLRFAPGYEPRGSFDICILGRDPMGTAIDQIAAGESIANHPVHIVRVSDPTAAHSCTILFLSSSEAGSLREDMALLTGSEMLTVSDLPDFLDHGGMIQFVMDADHVRFEVNLDAINRTHLSLGSELLRVAASVKGSPNAGGQR